MAEHVIIRRKLRLDTGDGDIPSCTDVHALGDVGNVHVHILQHRIEAILSVMVDQLAAELSFVGGETIVRSEEGRQMKSPVNMIPLH